MQTKTKQLTLAAMFCALSFAAVALIRIPVVAFLSYEPKDIIIALGGLILGPLYALLISVVTSLIELVTISSTGIIGLIMNILSSCSFAVTAAVIYKKKRTLNGAIVGLAAGCAVQVIVMLLWNYIITPLYMNTAREEVFAMLLPVFLPFNLLKAVINSAMTFLLYKPVIGTLRKTKLIHQDTDIPAKKTHIVLIAAALFILLTCVLIILSMNGII